MNRTRLLGTVAATAALGLGLAACGGAAPATPAAPASAAPAADPNAATCDNLLKLDAVPTPDGDPSAPPDPEGNKTWGNAVLPLLTGAVATAPAEVRTPLSALQPVVQASATQGAPIPFDDPAVTENIAKYESWAYQNCGYQQVSVMGADYRFEGMPATLRSGPTAIQMMNHSAANQVHVMLIAKSPDPNLTVEQVVAMPMDQLMTQFQPLPGAVFAPPGQQGGLLVDLAPGTYFFLCPVGEEYGTAPHFLQGMINKVTVT
ncbi:hypothetical protein [Pseudonocardia oroxyli]|uniref:Copper binding protein, plastocyanin/azurin family n=1 Tax=Pseudonocardia oroxyli TaxID=366584 RepID=A0A1G7N0N5_PSEOR|nr:hypothetical protein [Pseudonocardia oroxyli]SDF66880.1 hypothetical protein SAMN05216377_10684 [Pseudonocardia oroxyli]